MKDGKINGIGFEDVKYLDVKHYTKVFLGADDLEVIPENRISKYEFIFENDGIIIKRKIKDTILGEKTIEQKYSFEDLRKLTEEIRIKKAGSKELYKAISKLIEKANVNNKDVSQIEYLALPISGILHIKLPIEVTFENEFLKSIKLSVTDYHYIEPESSLKLYKEPKPGYEFFLR